MRRGYVIGILLIFCLLSTGIFADGNGNVPAVSVPQFSITSFSEAGEQASPATYLNDTVSLNLLTGWNFISTPDVLAEGHNTMGIFSGVNSSGHSIFAYNGSSSSWSSMKVEDLFYPLYGLWIYSIAPADIPLVSDNVTIPPRTLVQGWNGIGIGSPDRIAGSALAPLESHWSYLVGYNRSVQQYTEPLVAGDPAVNKTTLHTKEGFWIYMKENGTYSG